MQIRREVQAVLYNRFGKETRILLVKKLSKNNFSYQWRLLKGGIEGKETDKQALEREIFEEVGLRDIMIEKKINEYEFDADGTLHQVASYAVKVMENAPLKVQESELIGAEWVAKKLAIKTLFWENERESVRRLQVPD